jgi:hypothetical protein
VIIPQVLGQLFYQLFHLNLSYQIMMELGHADADQAGLGFIDFQGRAPEGKSTKSFESVLLL